MRRRSLEQSRRLPESRAPSPAPRQVFAARWRWRRLAADPGQSGLHACRTAPACRGATVAVASAGARSRAVAGGGAVRGSAVAVRRLGRFRAQSGRHRRRRGAPRRRPDRRCRHSLSCRFATILRCSLRRQGASRGRAWPRRIAATRSMPAGPDACASALPRPRFTTTRFRGSLVELLERLDRSRFECFAYELDSSTRDATRAAYRRCRRHLCGTRRHGGHRRGGAHSRRP